MYSLDAQLHNIGLMIAKAEIGDTLLRLEHRVFRLRKPADDQMPTGELLTALREILDELRDLRGLIIGTGLTKAEARIANETVSAVLDEVRPLFGLPSR